MRYSYDSEELIEELQADIIEFGPDALYWGIWSPVEDQMFITDYDFYLDRAETEAELDEGEPYPEPIKLNAGEKKKLYKASELLEILIDQNRII